jgi:hypothetical protein
VAVVTEPHFGYFQNEAQVDVRDENTLSNIKRETVNIREIVVVSSCRMMPK